jgi:hypothetical protein
MHVKSGCIRTEFFKFPELPGGTYMSSVIERMLESPLTHHRNPQPYLRVLPSRDLDIAQVLVHKGRVLRSNAATRAPLHLPELTQVNRQGREEF